MRTERAGIYTLLFDVQFIPHQLSYLIFIALSRGGVLEAEGTVEIKFRKKDLLKSMGRIDAVYSSLAEQLGKFFIISKKKELQTFLPSLQLHMTFPLPWDGVEIFPTIFYPQIDLII